MPHVPARAARGLRILLSLIIFVLLILQSSWFFAAMCIMAGAMVFTGVSGSWKDWLTWIGMLVGFSLFAELRAQMGPAVEVRPFYLYVIQLETLGGLIGVPTVWLQQVLPSSILNAGGILDAVLTFVYISFFIAPQVVVVYLWGKGGPFPRYVMAACMFLAAALVVHYCLPTAPPWMAARDGLIPPVDRIGIRVLEAISSSLTQGGYDASANDVAAMPSVHLGLTVLPMMALAVFDPRTRILGWIYGISMVLAITYLGEHYAVDGIVGAGMAWVAWWVAGRILPGPSGEEGAEDARTPA